MPFNTLPANPFPPSSEQMGAGGGGSYVLPVASADTLGGVKVGANLSIADGVLSAGAPYTLPNASADTLGGVKVGTNLSIDENGVLSASGGSNMHTYSTTEQEVGTWIDGKTIYEKTYILRENSVDKFAKGGVGNSEYLIGLDNVVNLWVAKIQSFRTSSGNTFVDSHNISNELVVTFDITTGGLYFNTNHNPSDVSVVLQYTKSESEG